MENPKGWIPAESIVELEDMLCDFMSHTLDSCTDPRRDTKVWKDICNVLFNTIQELKSIDVNNKEEVG